MGDLTYADDVMVIPENKVDIERLLYIVNDYGKEWDLKFNSTKCKVMESNTRKGSGYWGMMCYK